MLVCQINRLHQILKIVANMLLTLLRKASRRRKMVVHYAICGKLNNNIIFYLFRF